MRFLLLGGIGYLGGRLANHLKQQGHYVRVTTRRPPARVPSWLQVDDVLQADPLDIAALRPAYASIDIAIDLAAPDEVKSNQDPREALQAGGEGTWNILQALSELPRLPALIYLSTFHVYGSNARGVVDERMVPAPAHPYALGKYVGECVVQAFRRRRNIQGLCVRLSNAFGAPAGNDVPRWSLVFNDLCRQAVLDRKLTLKSAGTQRRNFIPLSDAVRALEYLSLNRSQWPEDGILHVGSETQWSILEVAEKVAQSTHKVLGFLPPIIVPTNAPSEGGQEFQFSVERLKKLGFRGSLSWEQEVQETLNLLRYAAQPANPRG